MRVPKGPLPPQSLAGVAGTYNQSFSRNYSSESEYGDAPSHPSAVLMWVGRPRTPTGAAEALL
jgi:hypothetical protein